MNWYKRAAFIDYTRGEYSMRRCEIYQNPTLSEWGALGYARILVDPNSGSIYAASSQCLHVEIRNALNNIPGYEDFIGMEGNASAEGTQVILDLRSGEKKWIMDLIKSNNPNVVSIQEFDDMRHENILNELV